VVTPSASLAGWLLASAAFLTAVGHCAAVESSQERMLPIRGEALWQRLRQPIPEIDALSISPDGRKVLYLEVVERPGLSRPQVFFPDVLTNARFISTLWMLDVRSGRKTALSQYAELLPTVITPEGLLQPEWSKDSRRLAFLDWRDKKLSLLEWDTEKPEAAPLRISLAKAGDQIMLEHSVRHWSWFSERDEVVLAMLPDDPKDGAEEAMRIANTLQGYSWYLSDYERARARKEQSEGRQTNGALELHIVNTTTNAIRSVSSDSAVLTAFSAWTASRDRRGVYLSSHVGLFNGDSHQLKHYQMAMLRIAGPGSDSLQSASRSIYFLDAVRGKLTRVATDGPGYIKSIAQVRGSPDLITAEMEPSLATWPTSGTFGYIRRRAVGKRGSSIVYPQPVGLDQSKFDAKLASSSESGKLYQWQQTAPEARLYEISIAKGERTLLSPADFYVNDYATSADGTVIVATMENANTPPALYIWSRATKDWRKLTDNSEGYARSTGLAPIEKMSWMSSDQQFKIDGFLFKPHDFDPLKKYPLLVFMHGGFAIPDTNRYRVEFALGGLSGHVFAEQGYLVLLVNPRGDRGYSVEFSRGMLGHMDKTVADLDAGADALVAKGWVDQNQISIMGQSGGGTQVGYAITHGNRYKTAISDDGPMFLPELDMVESTSVSSPVHPGVAISPQAMQIYFGFDTTRRTFADPYAIRTPLLLRWSTIEVPLPPSLQNNVYGLPVGQSWRNSALQQTKLIAYAMNQNHVPMDAIIDNSEHWIVMWKYAMEFQSRVLQWCDYFARGIGENPIPAMKSPLDYSEELAQPTPPWRK
jgi:dipeptidyl aminopeptidase/acylaminoacyl peptidase